MSSLIAEYRSTEETIRELTQRLDAMQKDPKMQAELDFETKLRALLAESGKSLGDIKALLDPAGSTRKPSAYGAQPVTRKARQVKKYKNPHNGEVIETKGGNHKVLKEWKQQHGGDTVESWLQS